MFSLKCLQTTKRRFVSSCGVIAFSLCACAVKHPVEWDRVVQLERARRYSEVEQAHRSVTTRCNPFEMACARSWLQIGESQLKQGQTSEALHTFLEIAGSTKILPSAGARAYQRAGFLLEKMNRPQRAKEIYRLGILAYPDETATEDALHAWVDLHRDIPYEKTSRDLHAMFEPLMRTQIADEILFALGDIALRHDKPAEAVTYLTHIAAHYRRHGLWDDALWSIANIYRKQRRYRDALRAYTELVSTRKEALFVGTYNSTYLDEAQLQIGLIYLKELQHPRRARAEFRRLQEHYPTSLLRDDAQYWIAHSFFDEHQIDEGCDALRKIRTNYSHGNFIRIADELLRTHCPHTP